jgi:hypothetical protein
MVIELSVIHQPASQYSREYWIAESSKILMNTNCRELAGTPIEFISDTKQQVIAQVISYLQAKGLSGKLRIV